MRFLVKVFTAVLLALGLAAAPRQAAAAPALWKATSRGATAYLFGTVHILPAKLDWMDAKLRDALGQSSELWTEADVGDLSGAVDALRHYGFAPAGETERLLPPDYRARYQREIREVAVSPLLIQHAQPWLAEILLSSGATGKSGAFALGADNTLRTYARAHKIALPTFETVDGQFALLADMPRAAQLASLETTIDEFDRAGPMFRTMVADWAAGDVAALDQVVSQSMRAKNETVWTELILRRNEKFAERIGDRLQGTGTIFVAVGAGHMCGSDGIPELLKRHGFTVTRIE